MMKYISFFLLTSSGLGAAEAMRERASNYQRACVRRSLISVLMRLGRVSASITLENVPLEVHDVHTYMDYRKPTEVSLVLATLGGKCTLSKLMHYPGTSSLNQLFGDVQYPSEHELIAVNKGIITLHGYMNIHVQRKLIIDDRNLGKHKEFSIFHQDQSAEHLQYVFSNSGKLQSFIYPPEVAQPLLQPNNPVSHMDPCTIL